MYNWQYDLWKGKMRMIQFLKRRKLECILVIILLIFMGATGAWSMTVQESYEHYNNEDVTYVKGKVL